MQGVKAPPRMLPPIATPTMDARAPPAGRPELGGGRQLRPVKIVQTVATLMSWAGGDGVVRHATTRSKLAGNAGS